MATAAGKAQCIICRKERSAVRCEGCSQAFCYDHIGDHRQKLSQELVKIEDNHDILRQTLTEQTTNPQQHPLIKQIDQWEKDSIKTIQQTAKECKQLLLQHTTKYVKQLESNFATVTDQLRKVREENDFNEINLNHFKQKLSELAKELDQPQNVSIQKDSTTLINKISVVASRDNTNKLTGTYDGRGE